MTIDETIEHVRAVQRDDTECRVDIIVAVALADEVERLRTELADLSETLRRRSVSCVKLAPKPRGRRTSDAVDAARVTGKAQAYAHAADMVDAARGGGQ